MQGFLSNPSPLISILVAKQLKMIFIFDQESHNGLEARRANNFQAIQADFFVPILKLLHWHAVTATFGYSLVQKLAFKYSADEALIGKYLVVCYKGGYA